MNDADIKDAIINVEDDLATENSTAEPTEDVTEDESVHEDDGLVTKNLDANTLLTSPSTEDNINASENSDDADNKLLTSVDHNIHDVEENEEDDKFGYRDRRSIKRRRHHHSRRYLRRHRRRHNRYPSKYRYHHRHHSVSSF